MDSHLIDHRLAPGKWARVHFTPNLKLGVFVTLCAHDSGKDRFDLANSCEIKHTPGRETDISDFKWIAELSLNGLIKPSRIFPKG
jgi:hypothetical protein